MISLTDIYTIIKPLNRKQRLDFENFCSEWSPRKSNELIKVMQLFSRSNKLPDEITFEKIPFFSNPRNRLYFREILIDFLSFNRERNSFDAEIKRLLSFEEYLTMQRHYQIGRKVILRAKEMAIEDEEYSLLLQILERERFLIKRTLDFSVTNEMLENEMQTNRTLELLSIESKYGFLHDYTYLSLMSGDRIKPIEIMNNNLMRSLPAFPSFKTQKFYHSIKAMYFASINQNQNVINERRAIITLMESKKSYIHTHSYLYLNGLINLARAEITTGNFEQVSLIENKIKTHFGSENPEVFIYIYFLWSSVACGRLDTTNLDSFSKEFENDWERFIGRIDPVILIETLFHFAILHFLIGQYKNSKKWLERIVNHTESQSRMDIQKFVNYFLLVFCLEEEDFDSLTKRIRSLTRKDKKVVTKDSLENLIVNNISRLSKNWSYIDGQLSESTKNELVEFRDKINILAKYQQNQMGLNEILVWIESKLQGILPIEIAKRLIKND